MLGDRFTPLRDGATRLRDWGLFLLAAALPAVVVGVVGLRALRNEEAALRRELRTQAEATALAVEQQFQMQLDALHEGVAAAKLSAGMPWAQPVRVEAASLEPELGAAEGEGEASSSIDDQRRDAIKRCRELVSIWREAEAEEQRTTADTILSDCEATRSARGRSLWPLVALDPRVAVSADSLTRWLDTHAPRLDAVERETIRREIHDATWLDAVAKAALEDRLVAAADGRPNAVLVPHRYAMQLGRDPVQWSDRRSTGRLARLDDGSYRGVVVHAGSIAHAMESGWPTLPEGFEARLSTGGGPSPFPISHDAALFGDLRLVVGHPDPDEVARRSKAVLAAVAVGSGLLAIALAALLFARMRRARQLSALRTDFVAAVSHELRTPIASVRMLAELLAEDRVEDDERDEVHRALAAEAKRLGATVDRLLGFSRMEAGKARIDKRPTDLVTLAEEAIATFEARHPDAEVTRRFPDELTASVDAEGLTMVIDNLLGNARKYAPEGAPYEVQLARESGGVCLRVRDHGPGIAKRHQQRIFRPFERADDRLSEATEGSGIGLSLVSHVAHSHGGRVEVESEPGKGATFIVWLPDDVTHGGDS